MFGECLHVWCLFGVFVCVWFGCVRVSVFGCVLCIGVSVFARETGCDCLCGRLCVCLFVCS